MPTVSLGELIDDFDAFLDRAEAGEEFTITVSSQPVATLGPALKYWVDGSVLEELAKLPVDPTWIHDLEHFGGIELRNPWGERG